MRIILFDRSGRITLDRIIMGIILCILSRLEIPADLSYCVTGRKPAS